MLSAVRRLPVNNFVYFSALPPTSSAACHNAAMAFGRFTLEQGSHAAARFGTALPCQSRVNV
jgi:hypothetical protein